MAEHGSMEGQIVLNPRHTGLCSRTCKRLSIRSILLTDQELISPDYQVEVEDGIAKVLPRVVFELLLLLAHSLYYTIDVASKFVPGQHTRPFRT